MFHFIILTISCCQLYCSHAIFNPKDQLRLGGRLCNCALPFPLLIYVVNTKISVIPNPILKSQLANWASIRRQLRQYTFFAVDDRSQRSRESFSRYCHQFNESSHGRSTLEPITNKNSENVQQHFPGALSIAILQRMAPRLYFCL